MMRVASRGRAIGVIAALLIHAILLAALLRQTVVLPLVAPRVGELVFIQPPAPKIKPVPAERPTAVSAGKTAVRPAPPASPALPQPRVAEPVIAAPAEDPFNTPQKFDVGALVKQAGQADKAARPAGENQQYGPVTGSMQAILNRAFTEAKLAVPPKWYEAARIELFSAPNDPKKIYQITTAFGTYCLFYPDPRQIDGRAQGSQPRAGNCPVPY
ncbi:hypothetical protein IP92_02446 [Pseudoduganella flava]|uniref:Uncharacterized protein n=1 Tax=Pseudoduganella flava TaxID=871742 RepID=A0A562PTH1_9BURK|nr:hypothetical protein [Pseudoduganella flava]QGZ39307.1 hypothetical protein GO485_09785 [Pseudoduganella flava]TWI47386.1 hypothetical protein IP92_02446 [Pseudoduganella flava]